MLIENTFNENEMKKLIRSKENIRKNSVIKNQSEIEDRFQLIFEHSPVGMSITGIDGTLKVNGAFCSILGYSEEELRSKNWKEITHPDDIKESQNIVNSLLTGERNYARYEKRYVNKSGNIVWTDVSTAIHNDSKGKPICFITMVNDITSYKETLERLRKSEERSSSFIGLTGQIAWITNAKGEVEEDIPYFRDFTGQTYDEVKATGWTSALHPDDIDLTLKIWNEAVTNKSKYEAEYRIRRSDGKYRNMLAKGFPILDKNGTIHEWIGTCHDITEFKQNSELIKNNEKRLRELIEALPQLFWTCRVDGPCDYLSKQWVEYTGVPESEQLGYRWLEQLHPEDKDRTVSEWMEKVKTGDSFDIEFRIRRNDGVYHWFKTTAVPMHDSQGNIIKWFGSNTDFDEIKKTEEKLKNVSKELEEKVEERTKELLRSKKLLDETARLARVGGWEIDLKANSLYWSETTYKIHEVDPGFVPDVAKGINFYAPEAVPVISRCVEKAITLGESFDEELELITAKGNRLWVRAIGEAYREKGQVVKVGGVFQDINTSKLAEIELKKYRDHLEEIVSERTKDLDKAVIDLKCSNQELEQFAYVASHDLQEPLRMVSSYTQLLEKRYKDILDQDAKDFIFYAVDGATRMQRLINDLLDYSRITTRAKPFLKVDLSAVLGQSIINLQTKIQETGSLIINDELPFAFGDELQLVRVFQNLLDNAIKFRGTESPRISFTSKTLVDKVQISIKDNGIGLDKIYSERVFTIFQRLHNKTEYPGTGIGLAICKRTIERHGGKIWFESEPGMGTTFFFTLNIK
jgi:PAS domain S-box-containing protein